jgi:IS1 family transposase
MAQIEGVNQVMQKLAALKKSAAEGNQSVVVGYTQKYALYVHEDLNARHAPGKQAKYLEDPARRLRHELAAIVQKVYLKTRSIAQSLLMAGLRLQRESQMIVPVDTSALRASAFTALEKDVDTESKAAFARSQALRRLSKGEGSTKQMSKDVETLRKAGLKVSGKRRRK